MYSIIHGENKISLFSLNVTILLCFHIVSLLIHASEFFSAQFFAYNSFSK